MFVKRHLSHVFIHKNICSVEIAPGNPDVTVDTPSKLGENPVNVETRLLPGKPLCHKGFRGYPQHVEIALVPPYGSEWVTGPEQGVPPVDGHTGGNGGNVRKCAIRSTAGPTGVTNDTRWGVWVGNSVSTTTDTVATTTPLNPVSSPVSLPPTRIYVLSPSVRGAGSGGREYPCTKIHKDSSPISWLSRGVHELLETSTGGAPPPPFCRDSEPTLNGHRGAGTPAPPPPPRTGRESDEQRGCEPTPTPRAYDPLGGCLVSHTTSDRRPPLRGRGTWQGLSQNPTEYRRADGKTVRQVRERVASECSARCLRWR